MVTNGNGKATPGLVTTGNLVGVPYELHITFTFTPYDNSGPFSDTTDLVKPAPKSGRLADCTINYTQAGSHRVTERRTGCEDQPMNRRRARIRQHRVELPLLRIALHRFAKPACSDVEEGSDTGPVIGTSTTPAPRSIGS